MTTPEPPTEPQQQCYELMAHCKAVAAELTQARFEIEALNRRLAEYASENQRLRAELENERLAKAGLLRANDSLAAQAMRLKADSEQLRSVLERLADGDHVGTPINQCAAEMALIREALGVKS
jgi:regulator of replication initiation timing